VAHKPTAVALRHVAFEDLGSFRAPLEHAGYEIQYLQAGEHDLAAIRPDLLVVLGGPVGVYDEHVYPFLRQETELLSKCLVDNVPTIGICLGAQLIAHALGERVYPGPQKEIGWAPLELTDAGRDSPLRSLSDLSVLHWHGDTFDLPLGCELLASTTICRNQAFAMGNRVLGLQFHPEVEGLNFERWLIGHAVEISGSNLSPKTLREQAELHSAKLEAAATALIQEWLRALN